MSEEHIMSLRETCARIEETLKSIAKELMRLEKKEEAHDLKLAELERGNEKQKQLNNRIQTHLDTDIPHEVREGQIAKEIVKFVLVGAGSFVLGQLLPKLLG